MSESGGHESIIESVQVTPTEVVFHMGCSQGCRHVESDTMRLPLPIRACRQAKDKQESVKMPRDTSQQEFKLDVDEPEPQYTSSAYFWRGAPLESVESFYNRTVVESHVIPEETAHIRNSRIPGYDLVSREWRLRRSRQVDALWNEHKKRVQCEDAQKMHWVTESSGFP